MSQTGSRGGGIKIKGVWPVFRQDAMLLNHSTNATETEQLSAGQLQVTWLGQVRGGRNIWTSGRWGQLGQWSASVCRWAGLPSLAGQLTESDCNPCDPTPDCTCTSPWQPSPWQPLHLREGLVSHITMITRQLSPWQTRYLWEGLVNLITVTTYQLVVPVEGCKAIKQEI